MHGSLLTPEGVYEITLYAKWIPIEEFDGSTIQKAIPIGENSEVTVTTINNYRYYLFVPTQTKQYIYQSYVYGTQRDVCGAIFNSEGA
jgi:hypothetical protein